MKVITFQDIASLKISPSACYNWWEEMIGNKKSALLPPKISLKPAEGVFCNVMLSIIQHPGYGSVGEIWVVTRYPGRIPSLEGRILLMDAESGDFLAFMDGSWITSIAYGSGCSTFY